MMTTENVILSTQIRDGNPQSSTLPSTIFQQAMAVSSEEEAEATIMNVLSSLATQKDLLQIWKNEWNGDVVLWMDKTLSLAKNPKTPITIDDQGLPITEDYEPGTIVYEWWVGIQLITRLLSKLSSFEIHTVAMQSSVFSEESQGHWVLCLLLCVNALRQCPSPLEKRWKRWQSMTCETIRLFQKGIASEGFRESVSLWSQYIVPACQHVIQQLPTEALHTGLLSGLVGTTSSIVMEECRRLDKKRDGGLLLDGTVLLQTVKNIVAQAGKTEDWVFSHPWRVSSQVSSQGEEDAEADTDADAQEIHNKDIAWWSTYVRNHDTVAGMDTSWDEIGISVLAVLAFDDRPMTLTSSFIWKTWFPHVPVLFKAAAIYPSLEPLPLSLLDGIFLAVPEQSVPAASASDKQADAPYETFQLLSNCIIAQANKKSKKKSTSQVEVQSNKARSEMIVGHMKALLSRYPRLNQIKIVRQLVHDCPHPGLQAKFIDLLRPLIFEEECATAFWTYIGSFSNSILNHVKEDTKELVNTDDLIEKVEVYVGAITMIQLWCMVKGKLPKKIKGSSLGKFHKILKNAVAAWMNGPSSVPPNDYYRLYLLEGALEQLVQTLQDARQKKRGNKGDLDKSISSRNDPLSSETTSSSLERSVGQVAIVGNVDIFSCE